MRGATEDSTEDSCSTVSYPTFCVYLLLGKKFGTRKPEGCIDSRAWEFRF